jgi:hypothetical protein
MRRFRGDGDEDFHFCCCGLVAVVALVLIILGAYYLARTATDDRPLACTAGHARRHCGSCAALPVVVHSQVPLYNEKVDGWNSTFAAAFSSLNISVGILVTPDPVPPRRNMTDGTTGEQHTLSVPFERLVRAMPSSHVL